MTQQEWMTLLAKTVRHHRKLAGLTQIEMASLAGVGKTVVHDLEKGKITIRVDTMMKILGVLNIELEIKAPAGMVPHA